MFLNPLSVDNKTSRHGKAHFKYYTREVRAQLQAQRRLSARKAHFRIKYITADYGSSKLTLYWREIKMPTLSR